MIIQPKMFEIIIPVQLCDFSTGRLIVDIAIFNAYISGVPAETLRIDLIAYCLYKSNVAINSIEYKRNISKAELQYGIYEEYLSRNIEFNGILYKTLWSIDECAGGIQLNVITGVEDERR